MYSKDWSTWISRKKSYNIFFRQIGQGPSCILKIGVPGFLGKSLQYFFQTNRSRSIMYSKDWSTWISRRQNIFILTWSKLIQCCNEINK